MIRRDVLDLYSCAGGAARGYQRAGFRVTGIDTEPQPRYAGDEFHQGDALEVLRAVVEGREPWPGAPQFDAIHASPPCQDHSATKVLGGGHGTGWLLTATRELLQACPLPWVLENVEGAALARQADLFGAFGLVLCGCMFPSLRGLLYEDRLFETSFPVPQLSHVRHDWPQTKMGRPPRPGECMQVTGHFSGVDEARRRMQAPWMSRDELAQAIPPAYATYIGGHLLGHLSERAA